VAEQFSTLAISHVSTESRNKTGQIQTMV